MENRSIKESGCIFTFDKAVNYYNFDSQENSVFKENNFCSNKSIYFLVLYKKELYFIEVKSYDYFYVSKDKMDEQICKIYSKYIDSYAIIALSNNETIKKYQDELTKKGNIPKIILFITDNLTKEEALVLLENIEKRFRKKFKNLKINDIFIETLTSYNDSIYKVEKSDK